MKTDSFEP